MKVKIKMSIELHSVEVKDEKEIIEALEKYKTRKFKMLNIDSMVGEVKSVTVIKFPDRLHVNFYQSISFEDSYSEEIFDANEFDEIIERAKKFFEVSDENK